MGSALGLVAGYFRGALDEFIMRLIDVFNSIPFLLIALVVVAVVGPSFSLVLGLLALLAWNAFVRKCASGSAVPERKRLCCPSKGMWGFQYEDNAQAHTARCG